MHVAPTLLAMESSCDETAAAVVAGLQVRASVVSSQVAVHAKFGGVVPELASRHHLTAVVAVAEQALAAAGATWADIDGLAVTEGPGWSGRCSSGFNSCVGWRWRRGCRWSVCITSSSSVD